MSFGRGFGMSLLYSKEVSLPRSDSEYKHLAVALGQTEVKDASVFLLYTVCKPYCGYLKHHRDGGPVSQPGTAELSSLL